MACASQRHVLVMVYTEFLVLYSLVFVLTGSVNWENYYKQVCAFLNQVQSIQFGPGVRFLTRLQRNEGFQVLFKYNFKLERGDDKLH